MRIARWKTELRDRVLHSGRLRRLRARWLLSRIPRTDEASAAGTVVARLEALCRLARAERPGGMERVEDEVRRQLAFTVGKPVDWANAIADWQPGRMEKAVLLKPWLGEREKGVVLISFGYQWARLMSIRNLDEFARRYTLVLTPSWSPPHTLETTLFFVHYPGELVFSLISNPADTAILPRLSGKIRAVPLYASSWVNPELGKPVGAGTKDIDIVMVAGFGAYKRHFALFKALRHLSRQLRVVVIGQPLPGRSAADLLAEARQYGVHDRFELRESLPQAEVCRVLARAKTSVVLSRQEGSCVAVTESILADTPVAMYEDAVVGSRVFINHYTGRLLRRRGLAAQLAAFLAEAPNYSPRRWALENGICCHGSTRVLNRILKESALAEGQEWTTDIAVHHWSPDPLLLKEEDRQRLRPAYEEIRVRYGLSLGREVAAATAGVRGNGETR